MVLVFWLPHWHIINAKTSLKILEEISSSLFCEWTVQVWKKNPLTIYAPCLSVSIKKMVISLLAFGAWHWIFFLYLQENFTIFWRFLYFLRRWIHCKNNSKSQMKYVRVEDCVVLVLAWTHIRGSQHICSLLNWKWLIEMSIFILDYLILSTFSVMTEMPDWLSHQQRDQSICIYNHFKTPYTQKQTSLSVKWAEAFPGEDCKIKHTMEVIK